MKRLIAYFVSGVRTGSFFTLHSFYLVNYFPSLSIPKLMLEYFSPLYDERFDGNALVDFGRD